MMERLLESYAGSYDIEREVSEPDRPELVARAHFHVYESQYMISKKAVMYATNSDEYVWFFSVERLSAELCDSCIKYAWEHGLLLADHESGQQMVTRIAAIFLCDSMEEGAKTCVEKCRYYKSFQFSLKGWCECQAVAADLGKESAVSNRFGRETAEHLKNLMHPRAKRRGLGGRLMSALTGRK